MTDDKFEVVASGFKCTSDVPKGEGLFYRCADCGVVIPSVPKDNIGCECGNVFIDKDYWRLIVVDPAKLEVLRRKDRAV